MEALKPVVPLTEHAYCYVSDITGLVSTRTREVCTLVSKAWPGGAEFNLDIARNTVPTLLEQAQKAIDELKLIRTILKEGDEE